MKKFDEHKQILKLNPEDLVKEFDAEENPRDVENTGNKKFRVKKG